MLTRRSVVLQFGASLAALAAASVASADTYPMHRAKIITTVRLAARSTCSPV